MEVDDLNGQGHGHGAETLPSENDHMDGGDSPATRGDEWRQTFEARMDLMSQGLNQINVHLANLGRPQMTQEKFEDLEDDGEPLTPRKVSKIVNQAVNNAVSQSNELTDRRGWDNKARTEFPIKNPKFEAEFNRQWSSFRDAGGDVKHPKAVYKVCTDTARVLGLNSKVADRRDPSKDIPTGETPAGSSSGSTVSRRVGASKISDEDARVQFFKLKHADPKKVEHFKKRLEAKDDADRERARKRAR